MATGSPNFATYWPAGLLVHVTNGADFGFFYAFVWGQLFILTLVAHLFFGVTLGLLVPHFLADEDRGGLFRFIRGETVRE